MDMLDYAEVLIRDRIQDLPDGKYTAKRWMDGDVAGGPYQLFVTVTIADGRIPIDWTDSSRQSGGPSNAVLSSTYAASLIPVLTTIARKLPINGVCFRPIEIIAPEGSTVNPPPPAATNPGTVHFFLKSSIVYEVLSLKMNHGHIGLITKQQKNYKKDSNQK